ncbi:MAG: phosphoribosylanthranilate isomerase [Candidatus Caenarcaniphilales bacterium]|nr:phosphoribosylanthranilate isomerase [Candidatus Caenarcaniphilales bacterium]
MPKVRVKTCGITNTEDALLCLEAGAHALGFIFAKSSPRQITPQECKSIIQALPPFCERVGVFVDEEIKTVTEIVHSCGLSAVQLHGKENKEYILNLKNTCNLPIIKAFRVKTEDDFSQTLKEIKELEENVQAFLLDSPLLEAKDKQVIDAKFFTEICKTTSRPTILAGALNPSNIQEILAGLKPSFVDLCSGLEASPGKKDPEKIKGFFEALAWIQQMLSD